MDPSQATLNLNGQLYLFVVSHAGYRVVSKRHLRKILAAIPFIRWDPGRQERMDVPLYFGLSRVQESIEGFIAAQYVR